MNPRAFGMGVMSSDDMDMSGASMEAAKCSSLQYSDVSALVKASPLLENSGNVLSIEPLTFRVRRLDPTGSWQEILVIENIAIDWTQTAKINAFLFHPSASGSSIDCMEFFSTFAHIPEAHHRKKKGYTRSWKLGLTEKLVQLGLSQVSHAVITLVQVGSDQQIKFGSARILLED